MERFMRGSKTALSSVLLWAGLSLAPGRVCATELDLRVLVIAFGDRGVDPGREVFEQLLENLAVPYEVLDASSTNLTASTLYSGSRGRFNGILLTDAATSLPQGGTGFDAEEFALLHEYEHTMAVREAVLSGYPGTNSALGLDYGMLDIEPVVDLEARWVGAAGGTALFEYVNTSSLLPIQGFAFLALAGSTPSGVMVEPLLVDSATPEYALISTVTYLTGGRCCSARLATPTSCCTRECSRTNF